MFVSYVIDHGSDRGDIRDPGGPLALHLEGIRGQRLHVKSLPHGLLLFDQRRARGYHLRLHLRNAGKGQRRRRPSGVAPKGLPAI